MVVRRRVIDRRGSPIWAHAVALCLSLLCDRSLAGAVEPFSVIPTEVRMGVGAPAPAQTEVLLYAHDAAALALALGVALPPGSVGPVRYRLGDYPVLQEVEQVERWLAASFVLDHDSDSVVRLYGEVMAKHGPVPSPDSLVAFVAKRMAPGYDKHFDFASAVARELKGDCTEYAVLLAALARRAGIPARITLGAAVSQSSSGYRTVGHAWVEMLVDGRWRPFDAALAGGGDSADPVLRGYLRFGVLENEGPGYKMNYARVQRAWLTRVVVDAVGAAPAE